MATPEEEAAAAAVENHPVEEGGPPQHVATGRYPIKKGLERKTSKLVEEARARAGSRARAASGEEAAAQGEAQPREEAPTGPMGPLELKPGDRVVAKDLVGAKELNGLSGKVLSYEEDKGRYAVRFTNGGAQKLLKPDNIQTAAAHADVLRELFKSHPESAAKLMRLVKTGEVGFARFDDADLRGLLRKLLAAGYWVEDTAQEKSISDSLDLAEHPSGAEAIKMVRKLENADEDYVGTFLSEIGAKVRADKGLGEVFDGLKKMGHDFDF